MVMPGRMVAPPPDRSAGFNGRCRKGGRVLLAAREGVVGEGDVGADEDVVPDAQAVPELDAGFHRDAVANDDVVLDEGVGADVAISADMGIGKDDDELPDAGVGTDVDGLYVGQSVDLRCHAAPVINERVEATCRQEAV